MILRCRSLASALLFTCLLTSAPAVAKDRDGGEEREEQLRREVVELRREVVMRDLEIERLAEELESLRSRLAELESGPRTAPPPVRSPRPLDEPEPNVDLGSVAGGVEEIELEEPTRPEPAPASPQTRLRESMASESTPTESGDSAAPSAPAPSSSDGGEELYDRGYQLFHEGQYAESERAFRLFLTQYPDSDLADNGLFWIGESRWARGDFAAALESYAATVERYPDGNKVPDALLKAARCLETLGQVGRAVQTYEEVVLRFAGSAAAITAEERLQALR